MHDKGNISNQGRDEIPVKMILEKLGRMVSLCRIFSDVTLNEDISYPPSKALEFQRL